MHDNSNDFGYSNITKTKGSPNMAAEKNRKCTEFNRLHRFVVLLRDSTRSYLWKSPNTNGRQYRLSVFLKPKRVSSCVPPNVECKTLGKNCLHTYGRGALALFHLVNTSQLNSKDNWRTKDEAWNNLLRRDNLIVGQCRKRRSKARIPGQVSRKPCIVQLANDVKWPTLHKMMRERRWSVRDMLVPLLQMKWTQSQPSVGANQRDATMVNWAQLMSFEAAVVQRGWHLKMCILHNLYA